VLHQHRFSVCLPSKAGELASLQGARLCYTNRIFLSVWLQKVGSLPVCKEHACVYIALFCLCAFESRSACQFAGSTPVFTPTAFCCLSTLILQCGRLLYSSPVPPWWWGFFLGGGGVLTENYEFLNSDRQLVGSALFRALPVQLTGASVVVGLFLVGGGCSPKTMNS
jgi:hypothetical protein